MRGYSATPCVVIQIFFGSDVDKAKFQRFLVDGDVRSLYTVQETRTTWQGYYSSESADKIKEFLEKNGIHQWPQTPEAE